MKTLIKKEIRLLLPAWITAMLLAIVPRVFILVGYPDLSVPLSFFANLIVAAGLLFLGINSFGEEMSCNTFTALLSQPVKRPRIWRIKVATLAVAFISVWLTAIWIVWWQCHLLDQRYLYERPDLNSALEFLTLSALVAFSGGLWTTLLLRQVTGAFWFTLLTPLAVILAISTVFQDWIASGKSINNFIAAALILYSVAGFVLAWRLFMRAQDVQWTGVEVSLPLGKGASKGRAGAEVAVDSCRRGSAGLTFRVSHRFPTLIWKEFQLHQGALLIAAILLVLHLTAWFIRKFHLHIQSPSLEFVFEAIWTLWLLMPLLIGAAAIAEERRMRTLEPQLCLPVSRGAQLFVKFCVALVLSLVFGALMPVLIEGTNRLDQWPWIFAVAPAIFFASFYASSLGRTTLQGIGLAILAALVIYCYEFVTIPVLFGTHTVPYGKRGLELLKLYLDGGIIPITLAWLTFSNFKHVNQIWKFWTRNVITILAVFICVPLLARGIYLRPWELVLPLEPRGPVRISDPSQIKFAVNLDTISAILPDGRLWLGPILYNQAPKGSVPSLIPDSHHGRFIGGSNWVDMAADNFETVAVQSDGTLWAIPTDLSPLKAPITSVKMTKIGTDDEWSHVASSQSGFLILKKDGSLWSWGTQPYEWGRPGKAGLPTKINGDLASMPIRVTDETNWTELYSARTHVYATDKNGNHWRFTENQMVPEAKVDNQWSSLEFNSALSYVEVKTNGQLWYFDSEPRVDQTNLSARRHFLAGHADKEQLGISWKWKTATFGAVNGIESIIAIRSDGTLWQFPMMWSYPPEPDAEKPIQIGSRSDWIALAGGFVLAADGSIWVWDHQTDPIWLGPSRKPIHMGNIFEGASATKIDTHENAD